MSPTRPSTQRGFTLIESMVAVVLLSIGALALGALLIRAARTATAAATTVHATAAMSTEVGRLHALPYDQVAAGTTCVTVATPPFPHTRCTTVNNVGPKEREVIIVVTPSGNTLVHPDTVKFRRTKTGNNSALNTP
jgi:prepilin-type N-terminal cleavage/methylation domain-containing protein